MSLNISWRWFLKLFFWAVVPGAIGVYFLTGLLSFISEDEGLLTIQLTRKSKLLNEYANHQITDGVILKENFQATESGLGSVLVRFYNFDRINDDLLEFRIREKGEDNWYYENVYKVDQFLPDELFPFGFPVIENSKGKVYEFEIESLQGVKGNAVAISRYAPQVVAKYQLTKNKVFSDPRLWWYFPVVKILNLMVNKGFLNQLMLGMVSVVSYFLVVGLLAKIYVLWLVDRNVWSFFYKWRYLIFSIWLLTVLIEIFVLKRSEDLLLILLCTWMVVMLSLLKITYKYVLVLSMFLLSTYWLFNLLEFNLIAEKMAIWGYLLMAIGVGQMFIKALKHESSNFGRS